MHKIFSYTVLSTKNYDAALKAWSALNLKNFVNLSADGINYCEGESARQYIIETYGWYITDGGLNCTSLTSDSFLDKNITIYPNPTDSYINIESYDTPTAILIYNILGEKIITKSNTNRIDVKDLESGIYIINITNSVGSINKKFVKN
jgi:hypothetical protein